LSDSEYSRFWRGYRACRLVMPDYFLRLFLFMIAASSATMMMTTTKITNTRSMLKSLLSTNYF